MEVVEEDTVLVVTPQVEVQVDIQCPVTGVEVHLHIQEVIVAVVTTVVVITGHTAIHRQQEDILILSSTMIIIMGMVVEDITLAVQRGIEVVQLVD